MKPPCCASRRRRRSAPRRSAPIARPRPSTSARCASPTPCRRDGAGRRCSSAARTSAISPASSTERSPRRSSALAHRRSLDEPLAEGDCLRSLSRLYRFLGRTDDGRRGRPRRRSTRLEDLPPRARARARLREPLAPLHRRRGPRARRWSGAPRRWSSASSSSDSEVLVYALTNIGAVEILADAPRGAGASSSAASSSRCAPGSRSTLAGVPQPRLVAAARRAATTSSSATSTTGSSIAPSAASTSGASSSSPAGRALQLDRGRWTRGRRLRRPSPCTTTAPGPCRACSRSPCSRLVRARRGEPDCWPLLDEALALAEPTGELQRLGPAAAARAEAAWLEGAPGAGRRRRPASPSSWRCGGGRPGRSGSSPAGAGAPAWTRTIAAPSPSPWAAELAGDWQRAAELWAGPRLPLRGGACARRRGGRRRFCARPSTSSSASAPARRGDRRAGGCASAACAGCRAARAPRRARTRPG